MKLFTANEVCAIFLLPDEPRGALVGAYSTPNKVQHRPVRQVLQALEIVRVLRMWWRCEWAAQRSAF